MLGTSLTFTKKEKTQIDQALTYAQQAIAYDQRSEEGLAIEFFKKAVIILTEECKSAEPAKQQVLQVFIEGYKDRIISIEASQIRERNGLAADSNVINSILSYVPGSPSKQDSRKGDVFEDVNLNLNITVKDRSASIESILNIMSDDSKLECILEILEKTLLTGGQLTKTVYVPAFIWQLDTGYEEEDNEQEKLAFFRSFADESARIIITCINSAKLKTELLNFRKTLSKKYKESLGKFLLISTRNKKNAFEQYKNMIKKNLKNFYLKVNNKKLDYVKIVLEMFKNIKGLFQKIREKEVPQDLEDGLFQENKKFLRLFIREVIFRILINDVELKLNQYISILRKKMI
jgi:hypothetical protein